MGGGGGGGFQLNVTMTLFWKKIVWRRPLTHAPRALFVTCSTCMSISATEKEKRKGKKMCAARNVDVQALHGWGDDNCGRGGT